MDTTNDSRLDERIRAALATDRLIDFTTTGRKSGKPHRRETGLFRAGGKLYLTGFPGKRDWYANLLAQPRFTLHLKQSVEADLAATATPVTDPAVRRAILADVVGRIDRPGDLDAWVTGSPLAHIAIEGYRDL